MEAPISEKWTAHHPDYAGDERILYTPLEVAKMLGLSKNQIHNLLRTRELTSVKIGRSRRISRADIDAFLERHAW